MLSEIPQGWESKRLEDICEILDKFRVPLNSDERRFRSGSVPYWGANGIVDYIDESIFDEPLLLMPEDGGPFGEAATKPICHKIDEPVWVNNHAHVLRVTYAEREFVYQWFVNRDITDYLVGGTRAKLNQKALRKLPILLPPLTEQQRIADILSSVDASIQATQALIAQAERVQRGLMEELLTGNLGSGTIERGEVPEGWVQLGEVSDIISGQSPPSYTYRYAPEGLPFFQGKADFGLRNPTARVWCVAPKKIAMPNDILISVRAPVGPTNVADVECCIGRGLAIIRCKKSVDMNFVLSFLKLTEERISQLGRGSTFSSISRNHLLNLKIPLPPLNEQRRIANILSSVDDFMANQKAIIEQLIVTKKGLMDDLLTGRVRTMQ